MKWQKMISRLLPGLQEEQVRDIAADDRAKQDKPADELCWSSSKPLYTRLPNGARWELQLPKLHAAQVEVERFPTCLAIRVLRQGTDIERATPNDLLRRAIHVTPEMQGRFVVTVVDDVLTLVFTTALSGQTKKEESDPLTFKWIDEPNGKLQRSPISSYSIKDGIVGQLGTDWHPEARRAIFR